MDLNNKTLEEWLNEVPASHYPQAEKTNHYAKYISLADYLNDNVHKSVTIGASLKSKDAILLNDHGPEHIKTVISRASYLVGCEDCTLNPYEVYLLLCCIQLHDVGNIFGRIKHEENADEIMLKAKGICGRDAIEAMHISKILKTHGGKNKHGKKDKIVDLKENENSIFGEFRPRLIASILRFADELADDRRRSNIELLELNTLPKGSEIFHLYASVLEPPKINFREKSIELNFNIHKKYLLKKYGKQNEDDIFLIDEIYLRVKKMHLERIYCSRYWKEAIKLEKIAGIIQFYDDTLDDTNREITFEIKENGYPYENEDFFDLVPSLKDNTGINLDGEYFFNKTNVVHEQSV